MKVFKIIRPMVFKHIRCNIPSSTRFGHNGLGCVIGKHVQIGDNVYIGHGTTIGKNKDGNGMPVIEDDVWIGCNCTIVGGITIGRGSIVGAGSVVFHDVPSGVRIWGNPARVVGKV